MLTRLKAALADLQDGIERIRRNEESVAALGEAQGALSRDITDVAGQAKRIRTAVDALGKAVAPLEKSLTAQGSRLEALSGDVHERLPSLIHGLVENVEGIKSRLLALEASAEQRGANARQDIALAESHILGAIGLMAQEINATHNAVLASASAQQGLINTFEAAWQRIDSIEIRLGEIGSSVAFLPTTIAAERDRALNAIVERVQASLGSLPAAISSERDKALDAIAERVLSGLGGLPAAISAERNKALDAIAERVLSGLGSLPAAISAERDKALEATLRQIAGEFSALPTQVSREGSAALEAGLQRVLGGLAQTEARTLGALGPIGILGPMANEVNAALNIVAAQQGTQASLDAAIARIETRIATDNDRAVGLNLLVGRGMANLVKGIPVSGQPVVSPRDVPTVDAQIKALKKAAPNNFAHWHKAYLAGLIEGQRSVEGNLSHEGHVGAGYFRMFVNVHAHGRLLDFGCGPLALPSYLADWPLDQLAGFDPQPPFEPHPFAFATSLGETIPWPDASFETVVIATSLDHVYLLDRALAEVKRVLVPGGRLLVWTAIFPQTPDYNPYGPKITPPDEYHLFHPGRNWFYELFSKDYDLVERLETVAQAEMLAYRRKNA